MTALATEAVTYDVRGGVAWLTVNRPEAHNALNKAVRDGLFDGVRRFNEDDEAHVLVLTGAGEKAFCAGGDLGEIADTALKVPPPDSVPQFGRNIEVTKPVNEVVPAGDLADETQRIAKRIAANAPLSVRAAKRKVRLVAELPLSSAYDEAERIWELVYLRADAQEGPAAFRDKRQPKWAGR